MSSQSSAADVIVIGGGIVGTSLAWELAKRRAGRVVLLERRTIAAGASGRTGAILRRHYTNRPEAILAQTSFETFRDWSEVVGGDCGHEPAGVLIFLPTSDDHEANVELLHRNVAFQNSLGINSCVVSPDEVRRLQPFVETGDFAAASFEPDSGYVDSVAATRSMAAAAIREGAELLDGIGVARIVVERDRVRGVETVDGYLPCEAVVCAAGPWTKALLATAGVDAPITTLRVQIAIAHRPLELSSPHVVMLDMINGVFTRPWGAGRSLIGVAGGDQHDEVDPDDFDDRNDAGYPATAIATAARRIPAMSRAAYLHGHACLYDMSPDAHPILGPTGVEGLFLAGGFSGAGFKKGPAVGRCLAELIVDGRSSLLDLAPFHLSRFATDAWRRPWSDTEYVFTSDFGHGL